MILKMKINTEIEINSVKDLGKLKILVEVNNLDKANFSELARTLRDEVEFARKIKKALRSVHIFITSDERQDTEFIRKRFYEWRRRTAK